MTKAIAFFRPFLTNPVVTRDLRVQMRGTRSYIQQAAYLLLLGLISILGYASSTGGFGNEGAGIVEMQSRLQGFYYYIFFTLAALIALIAPALTASSITSERQRQTLDLLVTTPLSAMELLMGKLISSVAFIALLLVLSLPASALCVMLGGATLGDVFQVYILLALDGLLLSAIGLYFSCAMRTNIGALVWTYLLGIIFLLITGASYGVSLGSGMAGAVNPLLVIAALNPFAAVVVAPKAFLLFGFHLPVWVFTLILITLFIRLLITAAAFRMRNFGAEYGTSLRVQILILTAVFTMTLFFGINSSPGIGGSTAPLFIVSLIFSFLLAVPFFPSLFVPAFGEDLPPVVGGEYNDRNFRWQSTFKPIHAGALPYFFVWLTVLTGSGIVGALLRGSGRKDLSDISLVIVPLFFYLSGLGTLAWALSRIAGRLVNGLEQGRFLAFGLCLFVGLSPVMLNAVTGMDLKQSALRYLWLFYPLIELSDTKMPVESLVAYGLGAYMFTLLLFPFWRRIAPSTTPSEKNVSVQNG